MKAVLDTNALISSVIATGVPHGVVVKGFTSEYQIIVSVATLTEFRETLLKFILKSIDEEADTRDIEAFNDAIGTLDE